MTKNKYFQLDKEFLLLGGHPILDFVNTKVRHGDLAEDRLSEPMKVIAFFHEVLQVKISCDAKQFERLIKLRQLIRDLLETLVGKSDVKCQLNDINSLLSGFRYSPTLNLVASGEVKNTWVSASQDLVCESVLISQFLNLFEVAELKRIKKCANPNCSHLFFDNSKNNTRSWCSMKSCGNIMKARAYYERNKRKSRV